MRWGHFIYVLATVDQFTLYVEDEVDNSAAHTHNNAELSIAIVQG